MEPGDVKILGVRGGLDFLIDAGTGDPLDTGTPTEVSKIYSVSTGQLSEPLVTASVLARGYWDPPSAVTKDLLSAVQFQVAKEESS